MKIRIQLTRAQKDILDDQAYRGKLCDPEAGKKAHRKGREKVLEAMIVMGLDALKKEQDKASDPADVYGPDLPAF